MGAVADVIEDVGDFVGDVVESVGDAISDVAEVAFDIVEDVGGFVGDVVENALDNPIATVAKIAAVATGNAWALPLISAGDVIVQGGSLEDAALAAGLTYVAQGVTNYVAGEIAGSTSNSFADTGAIEYDSDAFSDYTSDTPFRVEVSGAAGTAEAPQYVDFNYTTPGTELATVEQIDSGLARWNPAANAWETPVADVIADASTPGLQVFDDGSSIQIFDDGSTLITDTSGNVTSTPATDASDLVGPVVPDITEIPDLGEVTITDTRPEPPGPVVPDVVLPPDIIDPPIVDPEPEVPEIVITDTRPEPPGPVVPDVIVPPDIVDPPIVDPEPEVPEIVITDTPEPPLPPVPPDVVVPPDIVDPPIVDPEPPIDLTPYIPIVVVPPYVPPTPPVTPPSTYVPPVFPELAPRTFGSGLNPGFIQPGAFYNTTNPNQSKFYWGGHGYQSGPDFDQRQYNQVAGPVTPYGLQGQAQPLTGQQITDVVQGRPLVQAPVAPATRVEQYRPDYRELPTYGQIQLSPQYAGSAARTAAAPMMASSFAEPQAAVAAPAPAASGNMDRVTAQLGPNWFNKQQAAASAGDWDSYYNMQKQVDDIMYSDTLAKPGR